MEVFLLLPAILWNSAFKWVYLSFSPLPLASLLFSAICKALSDNQVSQSIPGKPVFPALRRLSSRGSLQAPLSMGSLQTRLLEWVSMLSSRVSSQTRDRTQVSCIAGGLFTTEPLGKPTCVSYYSLNKKHLDGPAFRATMKKVTFHP